MNGTGLYSWKVYTGSGNGLVPLDTHLCRNSPIWQSFSPSDEQPEQRKLAHMLQQTPEGCRAILYNFAAIQNMGVL